MDQNTIIRNLNSWLVTNPWHPSLTVLYDLGSYGDPGESQKCSLYLGEKKRGKGRGAQISQPDILVRREDTQTIELIVEVDFRMMKDGQPCAPRRKDLIGLLLAAAAADNHTPSYEYVKSYALRETIIVIVTAHLTDTHVEQHRELTESVFKKFHLAELGIRELVICGGASGSEAELSFRSLIQSRFPCVHSD